MHYHSISVLGFNIQQAVLPSGKLCDPDPICSTQQFIVLIDAILESKILLKQPHTATKNELKLEF